MSICQYYGKGADPSSWHGCRQCLWEGTRGWHDNEHTTCNRSHGKYKPCHIHLHASGVYFAVPSFFFFFVPFFPMSQYKIRQGCEDNVLMLGRAVTQCPRQGCEVNVLMWGALLLLCKWWPSAGHYRPVMPRLASTASEECQMPLVEHHIQVYPIPNWCLLGNWGHDISSKWNSG